MTEQQRATLQNQTNIIRDQLQQNQQFVEAGMNKLANKQALSEQEKEQTLTSLRTLESKRNKCKKITPKFSN